VQAPKTAAGRRSVAVFATVMAALDEHPAAYAEPGPDGLAFAAATGGFLRLENFRGRVWQPAVAAAGVGPLRVHDMRHTCASPVIAEGADIKVPQRMLGHASAALTLDRFGHLFPGQAQSVAERLDEKPCLATPADSAGGILAGSATASVAPLSSTPGDQHFCGGRDRRRSGDLALFRRALYLLSYPTAVLTGFEPAASGLTGRRALQTAPQDQLPWEGLGQDTRLPVRPDGAHGRRWARGRRSRGRATPSARCFDRTGATPPAVDRASDMAQPGHSCTNRP